MISPTRPVLRWHGGKWRLAPWIIKHFPAHRVYVEPFGGAASVLMRKTRAYAEVYNDLDDQVVGLFAVLRDPVASGRLEQLIRDTPFARTEFETAWAMAGEPVEDARRLIIRSMMGFGSHAHSDLRHGHKTTGFRANSNRSGTTPALDWLNYPDAIAGFRERLRGVVIERRDAPVVMSAHDGPETLHFVDPPYLPETRGLGNKYDPKHQYRHELTRDDHLTLLAFLTGLSGMVVLCGYASPLYDEALDGWRRVEIDTFADGARPRTEVLWINPAAACALDRRGMPLFQRVPA